MTIPSSIFVQIKMPWTCRSGKEISVTIQIENHDSTLYPLGENEYLMIEARVEKYSKFNTAFSEPFKLAPYESKRIKFHFRLLESGQYR
ncbi:hypothetical protein OCC_07963 [Thermococcus litoralis DSM 5473]|uniref:Uncharacterized protein n=1 Tax=Thermococcus litoralis (strain ATCC 51850 / DSM 5473 / JCM 8560 / NS-C) TaxID=523849 RepID=H3ZKY5_THELN|nr:hypothetical protein OCC_07963 [Thermococcus litoralis DSM 5473]